MDTIYSRRKIKLPQIIKQKNDNPKKRKNIIVLIVLTISVLTFTTIMRSINPIFETLCKDKSKSIATIICNEESTKVIKNYQYEDIITIYKDEDNNITMIKSNITTINLIISDIAENIQKRIDSMPQGKIGITLGSFTGSKILSGFGPTIPIKLSVIGNVDTKLESQFESAGINQTIHRIYLQLDCKINILTPYNNIGESISNQILIAENVIVGKIPNTYYNLDGITQGNLIDIMQ